MAHQGVSALFVLADGLAGVGISLDDRQMLETGLGDTERETTGSREQLHGG